MANSILPDTGTAGAVEIRDAAGVCLDPANVKNAYCPPNTFVSTCPLTALPSDCDARIEPAQINAIVSELLSFAECMDPGGSWSCESLHNICTAFNNWVARESDAVFIGNDPPPTPTEDQLWFESDTGKLYVWEVPPGQWTLISSPPIAGPVGPPGVNAYTFTTAGFAVPDVGSTVDVDLENASWVVVGQMLWISEAGGPGKAGQLQVSSKSGNTVRLYNPPAGATGDWAPVFSPVFTGNPQAPTPPTADNDKSIATTEWVKNVLALAGIGAAGGFTTGDAKLTYKLVADNGWILLNDGSIGDATSGGTTRANADTLDLFQLFWNNIPGLVVQSSTGTTVSRGTNALADYNAHRRLVLPKALGRALASAGAGSGLTARSIGTVTGAQTETPTIAKTATHNHPMPVGTQIFDVPLGVSYTVMTITAPDVTLFTSDAGSGTPLNIMQPTAFLNVMVKL